MFPIRKQKYNKKRFPIGIILIIFLLNLYFGEKMNIYAASIPFEEEGIAFDSEGNLWMVTHDKAAVTGIRYTTLGWTIKRYNSPIAGNQSVRGKLETYCPDKVDPKRTDFPEHQQRVSRMGTGIVYEWRHGLSGRYYDCRSEWRKAGLYERRRCTVRRGIHNLQRNCRSKKLEG